MEKLIACCSGFDIRYEFEVDGEVVGECSVHQSDCYIHSLRMLKVGKGGPRPSFLLHFCGHFVHNIVDGVLDLFCGLGCHLADGAALGQHHHGDGAADHACAQSKGPNLHQKSLLHLGSG